MPIPTANFAATSEPASAPKHVTRKADVIFRAGRYDFPAEQGGPFEMGPAEIKAFCQGFPGSVEIEDGHQQSVFNGKLGKLVKVTPNADFTAFGGEVEIPRWFDTLFPGQPLPLSARWNRKTKQMHRLAVVPNPRITDAAMFAAFAADMAATAATLANPEITEAAEGACSGPGCQAAQGVYDMIGAAMADPSITDEEKAVFQQISDLAASIGAKMPAATTTPSMPPETAPMSALHEARIKQLEEALFEQTKANWRNEGKDFLRGMADRVIPDQAAGLLEAYFQAASDDHAHPSEVCFSDTNNQQQKGTRLAAFRAMVARMPLHHLFEIQAGDGKGTQAGDALFNQVQTTETGKGPISPKRREELLKHSPHGKQILAEERAAGKNGRH